ncbi:Haloacid dehalogenase-like hydrolase domain-containing protein 3 [Podospora conica]|nr:Haloacid dehalogenase-like hydrolase domain-containing protein 3 [Schizothecium conicum]
MARRRHLLLCFDAFGTLFRPQLPIAEQYASAARESGLADTITAAQVQKTFKAAFASQSKLHPNYGRASGMGAEKWWTNVIRETFHPLTSTRPLPPSLAPSLLHRFSSAQGYALADPALPSLLRAARRSLAASPAVDKVVVGVITNSDDRVPSILASLGLRAGPLRAGAAVEGRDGEGPWDIDLHCMSYDVGHAKPDRRIFDAAAGLAAAAVEDGAAAASWVKVYVGDEFGADVVGGLRAGWNAVLVGDGGDVDEGLLLPEGVEGPRELDGEEAWERVFGMEGDKRLVYLKADTVGTVLRWLART